MARGEKLDQQTVYNIMASYAVTGNFSKTAEEVGVPNSTVRDTVRKNKNKEDFVELREQKKEEFSEKASEIINLLLNAAKNKAKALEDTEVLEKTKLTDITTAIGTLYDKRALAVGDSTENVTFKLPDEVNEFVR